MESLFGTFQHSGKRSEVLNNHTLEPLGVLQRARRAAIGRRHSERYHQVEPFGFVMPYRPVLPYRNPSTRKRLPSECSIPEKRKV